jgi:cell wall assembly regulator SMI1
VPFKGSICARIDSNLPSPFSPGVDHSPAWHPFLINEEVHGPAVDFAIHKVANATSSALVLVRASDLSQRHEISDKLKDFLQRAWACGLTSGAHLALVKTTVDE